MKRFALALKPICRTTLRHLHEDGSVLRGTTSFEDIRKIISRRKRLTLRVLFSVAMMAMLAYPNIEARVGISPVPVCGNGVQSNGEICFDPPVLATNIESRGYGVAVGSINGDADRDFVVSAVTPDQIRMKMGNGNGGFPVTRVFPMGDGPTDVAIADFNNDGFSDIIATNINTARAFIRWGHNNWVDNSQWVTGAGPYRVAVGDLNNDNRDDFVTTNIFDDNLTVGLRLAGGGFALQNYSAGIGNWDIELADVDGDGDLDLVYPSELTIRVRRNNGNGSFGAALVSNMGAGGFEFYSVTLADYNEDGRLDLIAARNDSTLVRVLGNGNGTFGNPVAALVGSNPWQLYHPDIDQDGHRDLIIAHLNTDQISILLGDGNGNVAPPHTISTGFVGIYDVGHGDFNTDGTPDLVFSASNGAYVMLSNP